MCLTITIGDKAIKIQFQTYTYSVCIVRNWEALSHLFISLYECFQIPVMLCCCTPMKCVGDGIGSKNEIELVTNITQRFTVSVIKSSSLSEFDNISSLYREVSADMRMD